MVVLLVAANVINIGAAAARIIPIPAAALMVAFTAVILILEIAVSYRRYAKVLKWLSSPPRSCSSSPP